MVGARVGKDVGRDVGAIVGVAAEPLLDADAAAGDADGEEEEEESDVDSEDNADEVDHMPSDKDYDVGVEKLLDLAPGSLAPLAGIDKLDKLDEDAVAAGGRHSALPAGLCPVEAYGGGMCMWCYSIHMCMHMHMCMLYMHMHMCMHKHMCMHITLMNAHAYP